ncbi:MAG: ATP-binding protein [Armatimonadetes bacterium]|nr:ATP-binding protein [Armatimonadota bacterium]
MSGPILRLADDLSLDLGQFAQTGWRAGVWASSGRGKSHTVGVITEELLDAGIPVVVVDPEGEMWTLRERYRTIVVGGPHGDLPAYSARAAVREILRVGFTQSLALVWDLSEAVTNAAQQELARPVLEELFAIQTRERRTVGLVIEEVQVFAPQSAPAATSEVMARIAKQGRKRGILLVVASQRTQAVSKEFMSQLNFPIIGGFEERLDYEAIRHHAGGKTFEELNRLPVGTFWFPRLGQYHHIRARRVTHGGDTPALGADIVLRQTVTDESLDAAIAQLAEVLRRAEEEERAERGEIARLKRQVEELQALLAAKDQEIQQLQIALKVAAAQAAAREQTRAERATSVSVEAERVEVRPRGSKAAPRKPEPDQVTIPAATVSIGLPAAPGGPQQWVEHPAVKDLLKRARALTRRRLGGYEDYCAAALTAMARAPRVSAEDLALALGLGSQQSVYRVRVACRQLVEVGLARENQDGTFSLHADNVQKAVALAEARAARKRGRQ